jgi:hypothetical protein
MLTCIRSIAYLCFFSCAIKNVSLCGFFQSTLAASPSGSAVLSPTNRTLLACCVIYDLHTSLRCHLRASVCLVLIRCLAVWVAYLVRQIYIATYYQTIKTKALYLCQWLILASFHLPFPFLSFFILPNRPPIIFRKASAENSDLCHME